MQKTFDSQSKILSSKEHPDLYHKSIKGGYWIMLLNLASNLLSFVKVLVIAHFFILEDLGIISIALIMMDVMTIFSETGFDMALIQKKDNIQSYLNTAWTAGVIRGIVLFLVLFFAAPFLALIQVPAGKIDLATAIMQVIGINFIIIGMRNVGTIYFRKEMEFKKEFISSFIYSLTDISFSLILIFIFRSIWGIIVARLIASVAGCIGTYVLSSYRPRLQFDAGKAYELWRYGKWIYGVNITGYLVAQGDNYFVWPYLNVQWLALYKYAFELALLPAKHITGVISSVSLPAYSKIQTDIPRLRNAYFDVLKVASVFILPSFFLMLLMGPYFVLLFLPERMSPMIVALQILSIRGFASTFNGTIDTLYRSIGKPKISWMMTLIFLAIQGILIYPLTKKWGIQGTALSAIAPAFFITPLNITILCRLLKCPHYLIFHAVRIPLIASVAMAISIIVIKTVVFVCPEYISFLLPFSVSIIEACPVFLLKVLIHLRIDFIFFISSGVMGLSVYAISLWIMDGVFKQGIRELIIDQLHKIKQKWLLR